ncbi:TetR/AcrR family transcriptional regulator C-terminal domain-containing protein [Nocardioides glacieisoli]|uniref:TetR/AcrR family transcriptional regulator C-terminal domain-containing protein n=1 Tax=Nocardioides glacieisoli TaxID=1168730 RepID=UPI001A90D665|nr:TetR/AcrR family transcriptional regulator C-terminal domain-containing protein [Nocardioides glacieisoli]
MSTTATTNDDEGGTVPARDDVGDADAALVAGEAPPSRSQRLSRERVVEAALAHIDANGLAGLSMRRLGSDLGVEAMALYRHVAGKEELLDAIVEHLMATMWADEEIKQQPVHGWQDFLQRLAHGVRRVALAHPQAFPLVASRPTEAPWLRPPLRSLDWVEVFLRGLTDEGFTDEAAVAAYRAFTSFLLGHLLLEVSIRGADVGPLDVLEPAEHDPSALDPFPLVRRLRPGLSDDRSAVEFEESLESLLDRLTLVRTEHLER